LQLSIGLKQWYNKHMLFTAFLWWWFGHGWQQQLSLGLQTMARVADFFSVAQLLRTLFSPFRQISAGSNNGSLGAMFQALVDNTVSRFIGAGVRTVMIFLGILSLMFVLLLVGLRLVLWPLLPLLPVVFIGLAVLGVGA
jgi:hypothetical protein